MAHKKRCPDCMGQGDKRFMPVPPSLPKQELTKLNKLKTKPFALYLAACHNLPVC